MDITIRDNYLPTKEEAVTLYNSVGWQVYTRNPDQLMRALEGSRFVVCAYHCDELVGLARIVGDGEVIAYLQDILVKPELHHQGIGRILMEHAFAPFAHCRQHVLLTDDQPYQRAFYEAMGFTESRDFGDFELRAFIRFSE
ncbi:MAG: GNAT family N-acetyltransferase [Corynebacterium sp.]|uniref:GNAT family N-acetyltransferase n=1 Tax=Corynebacterium sp. TaxID=1720 RepID=UPI0026DA7673|nr:GNAT family N-acetyltransferase [Corynebacterium sp.]MDO4762112.1 GNAT family N-acetyltransferase [Corynebacterium sp.]